MFEELWNSPSQKSVEATNFNILKQEVDFDMDAYLFTKHSCWYRLWDHTRLCVLVQNSTNTFRHP